MTPYLTLTPESQPIDTIAEYIRIGDPVVVELWKHYARQWLNQDYAFESLEFFLGVESEEEAPEAQDDEEEDERLPDPDLDEGVCSPEDPDEGQGVREEDTEPGVPTPEQREQIALYAPLTRAMCKYWTDLLVFTDPLPSVLVWQDLCDMIEKYVAFQPSDPERLLRHAQRLNSARIEADALVQKSNTLTHGSTLYEILYSKVNK